MIYLDHGATSFPKPPEVVAAVKKAMETCANPGRGSHAPAEQAAQVVFRCREGAAKLFSCPVEGVVFTSNCTHGLNMAIRTLVKRGDRVVISGFEHNAVTRPLYALGARVTVAGRRLFDPEDTLKAFRRALVPGTRAVIVTHVSNVFGYRLPLDELARMCENRGIPLVVDGAQSAGMMEVNMEKLGAAFLAVPGHKGLQGPMGTGMLLCRQVPKPLLYGGTGSQSMLPSMPDFLPDRGEAGTLNVPGITGLDAGIRRVLAQGPERIGVREKALGAMAAKGLEALGMDVYTGEGQMGTVSFRSGEDCEGGVEALANRGFALRGGLHCAPLAHRSAGTVETGTIRMSVGPETTTGEVTAFLQAVETTLHPFRR